MNPDESLLLGQDDAGRRTRMTQTDEAVRVARLGRKTAAEAQASMFYMHPVPVPGRSQPASIRGDASRAAPTSNRFPATQTPRARVMWSTHSREQMSYRDIKTTDVEHVISRMRVFERESGGCLNVWGRDDRGRELKVTLSRVGERFLIVTVALKGQITVAQILKWKAHEGEPLAFRGGVA